MLVKGMVMSECHKSPTFDAQSSADNLFCFLRKNLGISKFDIFRRLKGSGVVLPPNRADNFRRLSSDEMTSKCKEYKKNFAKLNKTKPARVEVRNIAGEFYFCLSQKSTFHPFYPR